MRLLLAAWLTVLLLGGPARANNMSVTNVSVSPRDATTAFVHFDISWENSWRNDVNHDAAWVFFKQKVESGPNSGIWKHVTLSANAITNPADYADGTGTALEFIVPPDKGGMFLRRADHDTAGTVAATNVTAIWDFTESGLTKFDQVIMQVFAVEMVYVAEGAFEAGDGASNDRFIAGGGPDTEPFEITASWNEPVASGPNARRIGDVAGQLWGTETDTGDWGTIGSSGTLNDAYPTGYEAFYCMKHLVTWGLYADFLNALTETQTEAVNYVTGVNGAWPNFTASNPDMAAGDIVWAAGAAFADWAGLRPMTELEFEKACRGPLAAVSNEYAWGNAVISGNFDAYPVEVGVFAGEDTTRVEAGASYWGIMELSGSSKDRTVTVGNAGGRAFTGLHGDGALTAAGAADVSAWPGTDPDDHTGNWRGGSWNYTDAGATVSRRTAATRDKTNASYDMGFRAVRSAP